MQLRKYSMFENWIPSTDVDEIDVNKNYVRDIINGDFHNGFISNAASPTQILLPTAIQALITAGWELLLYKYFNHSTQGDTYISVLYKLVTTTHTLKFFVNSTELSIDEQNDDITISAKPTIVNCGLVENQFKINLNVTAIYNILNRYVVLNLTVCYLEATGYNAYARVAGWYIFPRWIGWSYNNSDVNTGTPVNEVTEDFEDVTYITGMIFNASWARTNTNPITDSWSLKIESTSGAGITYESNYLNVSGLNSIKSLKFSTAIYNLADVVPAIPGFKVKVIVRAPIYPTSNAIAYEYEYIPELSTSGHTFELDIDMIRKINSDFSPVVDNSLVLQIKVELEADRKLLVDDFLITAHQDCMLIAKNIDGQRGLIKTFDLDVYDRTVINIAKSDIDWRVATYEAYAPSSGSIYYLIAEMDVLKDTSENYDDWIDWTIDATSVEKEFVWKTSTVTSNFNYGLGDVYVYDIDPAFDGAFGSYIYKEIFYRNRVYYVRNNEKVFYSHISGTGLTQPDSFPYDEDVKFGYLISDNDVINKALAVTPLEEIIIITEKNNFIYTIESVAGVPFRKVRANNGGMGILGINSLLIDFNGTPLSKILLWSDKWAVYGYAGGREAPIPITGITHKNFWQIVSGKDEAIGIYNKATNEYWIQLQDFIMIYEIDTNTWKKYELTFVIKDYVGIVDNYTYMLGDDNKIYKLDPQATTKLEMTIELHDDICVPNNQPNVYDSEIQQKILQDVYILWKDAEVVSGVNATLEVYCDDYKTDELLMLMNYKSFISATALFQGFGRIRFKLIIPPTSTNAKFKELGFWYTTSGITYGDTQNIQEGFGQEVGHEVGVFGG